MTKEQKYLAVAAGVLVVATVGVVVVSVVRSRREFEAHRDAILARIERHGVEVPFRRRAMAEVRAAVAVVAAQSRDPEASRPIVKGALRGRTVLCCAPSAKPEPVRWRFAINVQRDVVVRPRGAPRTRGRPISRELKNAIESQVPRSFALRSERGEIELREPDVRPPADRIYVPLDSPRGTPELFSGERLPGGFKMPKLRYVVARVTVETPVRGHWVRAKRDWLGADVPDERWQHVSLGEAKAIIFRAAFFEPSDGRYLGSRDIRVEPSKIRTALERYTKEGEVDVPAVQEQFDAWLRQEHDLGRPILRPFPNTR